MVKLLSNLHFVCFFKNKNMNFVNFLFQNKFLIAYDVSLNIPGSKRRKFKILKCWIKYQDLEKLDSYWKSLGRGKGEGRKYPHPPSPLPPPPSLTPYRQQLSIFIRYIFALKGHLRYSNNSLFNVYKNNI
jgi:hypothetical protein